MADQGFHNAFGRQYELESSEVLDVVEYIFPDRYAVESREDKCA